MTSYKKMLLYGFLMWLIPFITAFPMYTLKQSKDPLFETVIAVVIAICSILFTVLYFRKVESGFIKEGILIGLTWFIICIAFDLFFFMWGPMKMSFVDYMKDIGLTYLMIPAISFGCGALLKGRG